MLLNSLRKAGQAAENLLLSNGSGRLPTDLKGIIESLSHVRLRSYSRFMREQNIDKTEMLSLTHSDSGICFVMPENGRVLILYNDELPRTRARFTIAHELGHAMLCHHEQSDYSLCEREANHFAQTLLMPVPVLAEYGVTSTDEIIELCAVSQAAASIAWRHLTAYRQREYSGGQLVRLYSGL